MSAKTNGSEIDKDQHYGKFQAGEDRKSARQEAQHKLAMRIAHKAVDISDDSEEMKIEANRSGIGALGVAGIALAAAAIPGIMGLAMFLNKPAPVVEKVPVEVQKLFQSDTTVEAGPLTTEPGKVEP